MKYIFCFVAVLATLCTSIMRTTQAYNLTSHDISLIDRAEAKLINVIQTNSNGDITPQNIVDRLDTILEKRNFSERMYTIIDELAYRIWEYGQEEVAVLTEEDCYDDEYFDSKDQWCYLKENNTDDAQDSSYQSNSSNHHGDEDLLEKAIATYRNTDKTLEFISGEDTEEYRRVRHAFASLFPTRYTDFIRVVIFYENTQSDTAAYVEKLDNGEGSWKLAINIDGLHRDNDKESLKENAELFVHEMAHIITLNDTQMSFPVSHAVTDSEYGKYEKRCGTHFVQEGCLQKNAYLQDFVEQFWTQTMIQKTQIGDDIYSGKERNFVSDYAATNEGEDIAESYALYVVNPMPADDGSQARDKLQFFEQYSELVGLRTYIRKQLSSY